jgi:histone-lysine N-methyltransferase SUV420H
MASTNRWVGACGQQAGSEAEHVRSNNILIKKDVYEFDDNEEEEDQEEPAGLRHVKQEEDKWPNVEEDLEREHCITPPPVQRSVKLTLRMKRSPMLDEIIESGNSLSEGDCSGLVFEPEYEVLRVEGVEPDPPPSPPSPSCSSSSHGSHRKKRHKTRSRQRKHRKSSEQGSSDSSEDPVVFSQEEQMITPPNPPMKRLRLILGNETRTIDIPPIITKPT